MSRNRFDDPEFFYPMLVQGPLASRELVKTLTGAMTVDSDSPFVLTLDPGGATRVITMPAPVAGKVMMWLINNTADAAEDLTINNSAAATIGTISQNEAGLVMIGGAASYLRLVGTST
jgi:hypothetical protein